MNVTQIEGAHAYTERLPARSTHERMAQLYDDHLRETRIIKNKHELLAFFDRQWPQIKTQPIRDMRNEIVNQITAAEMRLRRVLDEIVGQARVIVAEADNAEIAAEIHEGPISCYEAMISNCPHDADPLDCQACYHAGDMAYDAAREKGYV